ncbi:MAG: site-specific integrase, partial [Pseudohongiella sp.]
MKAPHPLFDTLDNMPNPWREPPVINPALLASCKKPLPDSAVEDYRHACEFLYSYRGSPDTFSAYRRELEHFLQWAWLIAGLSLHEIQREHLESYVEFSRQPPDTWIGQSQAPRFIERQGDRIANPDWRPYQVSAGQPYSLSQSALQAMFAVMSSFFN